MSNRILSPVFVACLAAALSSMTAAQGGKQPDPPKPEANQEQPKPDPKIEEYEKAIKDLTKHEGVFTLYMRKKDILLELPESKLNQSFMIQTTLNTGIGGGAQAGDPVGNFSVDMFRFEKHDDSVWMIRPNFRFRWDPSDTLATASQRSFPEAILAGFRIEQTHPAKKLLLVNVTNLFNGDFVRLPELLTMALGPGYMLDRDKSGVDQVKSFPGNTVVRMGLHYFSQRGAGGEQNPMFAMLGMSGNFLEDSRSAPLKVTYNLWYRGDSDYRPRLSDSRVGYFTEDFYSLRRFFEQDRTQRYIMRWNLKKKDPKAARSEPVKPIVWAIDPSVPKDLREASKEAILEWNKAFDRLGYQNAVQVVDIDPKDPDYDHADARYNVLRYTMSPDAGYAIALFRTDPVSGEILNAAVTFDANMYFFAGMEHDVFVNPAAQTTQLATKALLRNPGNPLLPVKEMWGEVNPAVEEFKTKMRKLGWNTTECTFARDLAAYSRVLWYAIEAAGIPISKASYVKQFVKEVTMHEVGHCMGLRHNFVASTNLSTAQLADAELVNSQGVTASVMDYNPPNVQGLSKPGVAFYSSTIGPYDKWAIEYGYADIAATTPEGERAKLSQIAARSGLPGHLYMTDEDADAVNPFVVRFDNAKDPIVYSEKLIAAAQRIRTYALKHLPKAGDSYEERTAMILRSYAMVFREGRLTSRFIGGIESNRTRRGDQGSRHSLRPVDAQLQRDALRLISKKVLSQATVALPEDVMMNLSRNFDDPSGSQWFAPLREYLSNNLILMYATCMSADTTDRIAENQFKWGAAKDAYTLDEHFSALIGAVFSEIGSDMPINGVRRDLQRFAFNGLMTQVNAAPGAISEDVRILASSNLKRLNQRVNAQLSRTRKLDQLTIVHLQEMRDGLRRFMDRSVTVSR